MSAAYLVLWLVACAGAPRPQPAAPATLDTLEQAEARERARRYDEARNLYRSAVDTAPDDRSRAYAARRFAAALLFWGELEAAEAELVTVVRLEPADPAAWHDLGIVRHRRGDIAGAEHALRRALANAPRDPRPRIALAALLVNERRLREALAQYEALLELELPERTRAAVERGIELLRRELSGSGAQR